MQTINSTSLRHTFKNISWYSQPNKLRSNYSLAHTAHAKKKGSVSTRHLLYRWAGDIWNELSPFQVSRKKNMKDICTCNFSRRSPLEMMCLGLGVSISKYDIQLSTLNFRRNYVKVHHNFRWQRTCARLIHPAFFHQIKHESWIYLYNTDTKSIYSQQTRAVQRCRSTIFPRM